MPGWGLLVVLLPVVAAQAYVRLAPTDAARWHMTAAEERQGAPHPPGDWPQPNGFEAVRPLDRPAAEALARADRVIRATPRTRHVAGSLAEGRLTYVTRSLLWGFPDFTTVSADAGPAPVLRLYGRARFGRSDLGVNAARIRGWLGELNLAP